MQKIMPVYVLQDEEGDEFSVDPRDYWHLQPFDHVGGDLWRTNHRFRVVGGGFVSGSRVIKREVTMRDLSRLAAAVERMKARTTIGYTPPPQPSVADVRAAKRVLAFGQPVWDIGNWKIKGT